jgi:aminoglycoside phosphotransferase (APT) family kinase protein
MKTDIPTSDTAFGIVADVVGSEPVAVRRFTTGAAHYVFEAVFEGRAPVVIRLAARQDRSAMAGAARLSRFLRPLGVPLPEIIAAGLDHEFPYLILERLAGVDLGDVVNHLPSSVLQDIATRVAAAQAIVAKLPSVGRYGYAVTAAEAPHSRWIQVVNDHLARSRKRIEAAGLFDAGVVDSVAALVAVEHAELDSIQATPFLHDTTTRNVIVTADGAFSGIVDVDDLCFGDPRYVAALTLAALMAAGSPVDYAEAWMNAANYEDDYVFRLYVAVFIVDLMSEHGHNKSSSVEDRRRMLGIFAECMRRVRRWALENSGYGRSR